MVSRVLGKKLTYLWPSCWDIGTLIYGCYYYYYYYYYCPSPHPHPLYSLINYCGYYRFDEFNALVTDDVMEDWSDHFYPPNFENNMVLRDRLENILLQDIDEDPTKMKALEEFVEVRRRG